MNRALSKLAFEDKRDDFAESPVPCESTYPDGHRRFARDLDPSEKGCVCPEMEFRKRSNKKQRALFVEKVVCEHFPHPEIPLKHSDPYTLLIAVLLSAQCTDARVNLTTPHLFAKASTPKQMIGLTIPEITQLIESCGLKNTKAKAIWHLSEILCKKYRGRVPASFAALESLPGVGHKTASVVMSQAFHHPAFPVDTHIHRCAKRWGLSSGKTVEQTERDLKRLFPKSKWNLLHLQIIHFARTFCPARGHTRSTCPICSQL